MRYFRTNSLYKSVWIVTKISQKCTLNFAIDDKSALVQKRTWHYIGTDPSLDIIIHLPDVSISFYLRLCYQAPVS